MTADELRELADVIEPMGQAPRFSHVNVPAACAYLRACADALDAGPVATALMLRGELVNVFPRPPENASDLRYWIDKGYSEAPLYPLAMPAQAPALRLPEPMTDAEIAVVIRNTPKNYLTRDGTTTTRIARAIEAEVIRRVKEANE